MGTMFSEENLPFLFYGAIIALSAASLMAWFL